MLQRGFAFPNQCVTLLIADQGRASWAVSKEYSTLAACVVLPCIYSAPEE